MDVNKILHRVNLRGLVKCKVCNHFNGIRANACKNKSCKLSHIEVKRKPKPKIHAVQLITNDDSKLFSVQTRERDADNRNFVSITDNIISSDADGSIIISRSAICYVDTCKYDSNDINISCKHVKSSLEFGSTKAKVLKIELTTLNSFQLNDKEKQKLCKLYEESEKTVPLVQRISQTVFVVRCDVNFNFPAGLLHVVCNEDAKRARYSCACKRIKIIMSSNQMILEKDICEHLILVFMAIWSDPNLKQEFKFLSSSEFIPNGNNALDDLRKFLSANVIPLNNKQIDVLVPPIEDSMESTHTPYNDDNLTNATIASIDNLDNIELIQIPHVPTSKTNPNELTIGLEDEDDLQSINMETIPIVNQLNNVNQMTNQFCDGLELIKVVDQFEVEDQIEFRDDRTSMTDIQQTDQYFPMNGMCDMTDINYWSCDSNEFSSLCHNDTLIDNNLIQPINLFKSSKATTSMKMSANAITEINVDTNNEHKQMCNNMSDIQFEMYSNWLNSVIERLNTIMDYNESGCPEPICLSIPHLYFDILRAKFSAGTKKKRLPNHTSIIGDGKCKGLTLFCWIFSNVKLVKYIFSTTTMQLETVQSFTKTPMNTFRKIEANEAFNVIEEKSFVGNNQLKRIRPNIYRTFLKVKNPDSIQKGKTIKQGLFSVEWIPNILPKSQYGELRIKIQFGHMKNDSVIIKE